MGKKTDNHVSLDTPQLIRVLESDARGEGHEGELVRISDVKVSIDSMFYELYVPLHVSTTLTCLQCGQPVPVGCDLGEMDSHPLDDDDTDNPAGFVRNGRLPTHGEVLDNIFEDARRRVETNYFEDGAHLRTMTDEDAAALRAELDTLLSVLERHQPEYTAELWTR